jgi:putative intracellular protease/amidase
MKRLALLLAPGFEELEAAAHVSVFGWSRNIEGVEPYSLETIAIDREVLAAHGTQVRTSTRVADADPKAFVGIAIPGGFFEKGFAHSCDPPILAFLRAADAAGTTFAASTTGTRVLAAAGLLVGKRATTYPFSEGRHRAFLAECGATPSDGPIERDGSFLTGSTTACAVDLAFELLRVLEGDRAVAAVRRVMGYLG